MRMNEFVSLEDFEIVEIMQKEDMQSCVMDSAKDYVLMYYKGMTELKVFFACKKKYIRAMEFLDYIMSDFGKLRGESGLAGGVISMSIIKSQMADCDKATIKEFFEYLIEKYLDEVVWIDAAEYYNETPDLIKSFKLYKKAMINWAVVDVTTVIPEGTKYSIKSLENESGEIHIATKDEYIMIGCRGEVYCIGKEKFEKTYDVKDENFDLFASDFEYIPEIMVGDQRTFMNIDEVAKICTPKKGSNIFAKQIDTRTKIFNIRAGDDYFLGNPGDYIAIRADDNTDVNGIIKPADFGS